VSTWPEFDPERSWAPIEARIDQESEPRHIRLLEQVRDHLRTEIRGELPGLMATLTDEPEYHLWGMPVEAGPKGRAAVEAFYTGMIAGGGNNFHLEITRIVVDADAVVTEGRMYTRVPGSIVLASGIEQVDGEPVDAETFYLNSAQVLTVWPGAEDGRLIGENIYMGSPMMGNLRRE
jgi:hypothetical protein